MQLFRNNILYLNIPRINEHETIVYKHIFNVAIMYIYLTNNIEEND